MIARGLLKFAWYLPSVGLAVVAIGSKQLPTGSIYFETWRDYYFSSLNLAIIYMFVAVPARSAYEAAKVAQTAPVQFDPPYGNRRWIAKHAGTGALAGLLFLVVAWLSLPVVDPDGVANYPMFVVVIGVLFLIAMGLWKIAELRKPHRKIYLFGIWAAALYYSAGAFIFGNVLHLYGENTLLSIPCMLGLALLLPSSVCIWKFLDWCKLDANIQRAPAELPEV